MSLTIIFLMSPLKFIWFKETWESLGCFFHPPSRLFPGVIQLFPAIMKDLCIDKCGGETVVKAVLQVILLIPAGAAGMLAFFEDFAKFPLVNNHKLFSGDFSCGS